MKSDLKVICTDNVLIKYADDVDLLVPEKSNVGIADEFEVLNTSRNGLILTLW